MVMRRILTVVDHVNHAPLGSIVKTEATALPAPVKVENVLVSTIDPTTSKKRIKIFSDTYNLLRQKTRWRRDCR